MLKKILFALFVAIYGFLLINHEPTPNPGSLHDHLKIYRDDKGIAHVVAKNKHDLFYGIGFAEAQDRLWAMHIKKMLCLGRLSEMFGKDAMANDRYMRNINLRDVGAANAKLMDPQTKQLIESYSKGLNDYSEGLWMLPWEFYLFGSKWEGWTPADTNMMIGLFSFTLEFDWMFEIARERLKETVGHNLAMKLIPSFTQDLFREVTIMKQDEIKELGLYKEYDSKQSKKIVQKYWTSLNLTIDQFKAPEIKMPMSGSNAWVIGGNHTKSGRHILANDPHLGLMMPSLFYPVEMILLSENGTVINQAFGAMTDGLPGLSIGINTFYAWGSTASYVDCKDVYVEEVRDRADGKKQYLLDGKWLPLTERVETFNVKGTGIVNQTYYGTHRGPLLSSLFLDLHLKYGFSLAEHHQNMLSLGGSVYVPDGVSVRGLINIAFCKDKQEFTLRGLEIQNINIDSVFIGADNLFGYSALGRISKKEIPEMGSFVKNGTTSRFDVKEFHQFEERPVLMNPKRGFVAMTNNKFAPDSFATRASLHQISNGRATRLEQIITERIASGRKFDLYDMMAMQQDAIDSYVALSLKSMLKIFRNHKKEWVDPEFGSKIVNMLEKWDADFSRWNSEPSIYTLWEHEFQMLLLREAKLTEVERVSITNHAFFEVFFFRLIDRLAKDDTTLPEDVLLCQNNQSRALSGRIKNPCVANMIISFNKLENTLNEWFGSLRPEDWRWGKIHKKSFVNIPWTDLRLTKNIFNRPVEASGNSRTLNVGIHSFQKKNFDTFATATFRFVTDLNRTYFSIDTGVSDRITSKYYDNFVEDFNNGIYEEYIPRKPSQYKNPGWTLTVDTVQKTDAIENDLI